MSRGLGDVYKRQEENVRSIRPAIGIKPKYYKALLGKTAKKAYRFGEPIGQLEVE